MVWVYVLKSRDHTFEAFKSWKTMVENQEDNKIKIIRTDNGLEFYNNEFSHLCKENRILRHLTAPSNPKQNDLAERMNRTLLERVRCMIFHTKLPNLLGEKL